MYYIFLENEKLNGCGECKRLDCENIEVEQDIYEDYIKTPNKYTWEEKEIEVEIPDFETVTKTIEVEVPYYETIDKEIEVEVPVFETVIEKVQVQIGEDGIGNPIYEEQEVENQVQIGTQPKTETIQEQIEKTTIEQQEVEKTIQTGTHTENKTIKVIVLNPDYEKEEEEKRKTKEITELKLELDNLDLKTVRPLRAINAGTATPDDENYLKILEQQAQNIREELAKLQ